jgi:uncharacterized protein YbjT (DUF2867 family)
MILIIGGRGTLGRAVAELLLVKGLPVRVMTRSPEKAADLAARGVEVFQGDLIDGGSVRRACQGVDKIIYSAHALLGKGKHQPKNVDWEGHKHLIEIARELGIKHYVYVSTSLNKPDSPQDIWRYKYQMEGYLQESGLSYTILRFPAFFVPHVSLVTDPLVKKGKTTIMGSGKNPKNLIAVEDVAKYVALALDDQRLKNRTLLVSGPENLSPNQIAELCLRVTGLSGKAGHIPLPVVKLMSKVIGVFHSGIGRLLTALVLSDIEDHSLPVSTAAEEFGITPNRLEDWLAARYAVNPIAQTMANQGLR